MPPTKKKDTQFELLQVALLGAKMILNNTIRMLGLLHI